MPLVVPNDGETQLQDKMLKVATSPDENYLLRLYQNDYTPDEDTVLSDFDEADFTDYAEITLARATWNAAASISGQAVSTYGSSPQSWTCGASGNTIYGYYVVGEDSGVVLWAERWEDPIILSAGMVLSMTPTFASRSEF